MPNDSYDTTNNNPANTTPANAHGLGFPADWPRQQLQHHHHNHHNHHGHHRHSGDPSALSAGFSAPPAPISRQLQPPASHDHAAHAQPHQPFHSPPIPPQHQHQHPQHAFASVHGPDAYGQPFGQFGFLPTSQPQLQPSLPWPVSAGPRALNFHAVVPTVTQAPSVSAFHQLVSQEEENAVNRSRQGPRDSSSPLSNVPVATYPNPPARQKGPSAGRPSGSPLRAHASGISPRQEQNPASTSAMTAARPSRGPAQAGESPKSSRKRAKAEADEDSKEPGQDEPAKKAKPPRGRPRLTGAGESPSERRRKQIREAQRAYRNRKDQAITDLEEKVKKLEEDKTVMTQDISGLLGLLQTQGTAHANPEVLQSFRDLSHKYTPSAVGQLPRESDEHSATSSAAVRERASPQHHRKRQMMRTASSASSDQYTPHHSAAQARPSIQGAPNSFASSATSFYPPEALSYEVIAQPTPENASFPSYAPDPQAPGGWVEQPPMGQSLVASGLGGSASYGGRPPQTFGRRLHLATLRRGLILASMPTPPLERFGAVFGFCLFFETREDIITRLVEQIEAVSQAPMDNWEVPYPLVHGYSKRITEFPGYDGEAFIDSEAVGDYLLQRGVHIPGSAETVEVEFDPCDFGGSSEAYAVPVSGPAMSCSQAAGQMNPPGMGQVIPVSGMWHSQPGQTAGATSTAEAISTMFTDGPATTTVGTGVLNPFLYPSIPTGPWVSQTPRRVKATLNVSLLMDEIMKKSVCLGRTPGLRPADLDRAVRVATGLARGLERR